MDDQKISLLLLLDLSGAFDTIDHLCQLQTLKTHFCINGKVIEWIESYLADRKQTVEMDDTESDVLKVPFGVPQGSRLGPLLFSKVFKRSPPLSLVTAMQMTHKYICHSVLTHQVSTTVSVY